MQCIEHQLYTIFHNKYVFQVRSYFIITIIKYVIKCFSFAYLTVYFCLKPVDVASFVSDVILQCFFILVCMWYLLIPNEDGETKAEEGQGREGSSRPGTEPPGEQTVKSRKGNAHSYFPLSQIVISLLIIMQVFLCAPT